MVSSANLTIYDNKSDNLTISIDALQLEAIGLSLGLKGVVRDIDTTMISTNSEDFQKFLNSRLKKYIKRLEKEYKII